MNILINKDNLRNEFYEVLRGYLQPEEINFTNEESKDFLSLYIEENQGKITIKSDNSLLYNTMVFDKDIKGVKRKLKLEIKKYMEKKTGRILPWGILTGIRPVKIVQEYMEKGVSVDTIRTSLVEDYGLKKEKAELILGIGQRQRDHIYPMKKENISIYVNIPFCPTRCDYCSFPTLVVKGVDRRQSYVDVLIREIVEMAPYLKDKKVESIYFGGGTPTALELDQLKSIREAIFDNYNLPQLKEFTIEAGREDTIDREKLQGIFHMGARRISLNPQTMKSETLEIIGRKQDNDSLIEKFYMARDIGFPVINMDIIIGLPGESLGDLQNTLTTIGELQPENLTVHTLAIKKGAKFHENNVNLTKESQTVEKMIEMVEDFTGKNGYLPYYLYRQKQILGNFENVGYGKQGTFCQYNMVIMEETGDIVGFGMAANSKAIDVETNHISQFRNYKNLRDYTERLNDVLDGKKKLWR